jgi:hypothetical protein
MNRFTDRLWDELVREYGAALAEIRRKPPRRAPRPRILAGTGAILAAGGTTVALVLGAAGTSPAFAVTKNHDGSITLTISRMAGIRAANARLRALGYRARLVQVAPGCPPATAPSRGESWTVAASPAMARAAARVSIHTRFDPRQIPVKRLLVIAAWVQSRKISIAPAHLVRGAAPVCLPAPPPPAVFLRSAGPVTVECIARPPQPAGNSGNSGPPPAWARPAGTVHAGPGVQYYLGPPGSGGNSGNSGPPPTGNGGNSGNSGPPAPGNSGNSGGFTVEIGRPMLAPACPRWAVVRRGHREQVFPAGAGRRGSHAKAARTG